MAHLIRSFQSLLLEEMPSAGGKGGMLARLYQTGFRVPDGFVILPAAFAGDDLQPQVQTQVREQLAHLRDGRVDTAFAVRSSALSEDSAKASFAGEFETVLGVSSDEEVWEAIRTVRRSRSSERVQTYSAAKRMEATHEIAVVVQQMVPAGISGVLFTADPISGSGLCMTGNFVHGLGDQLVSGAATGKAFTLERPSGRYHGPRELKPFARKLYRLGNRLESELGDPQDVEWAICGRKVYLLQSRPITTLIGHQVATSEWNDSLTGDFLWSNVNFGEAVTEPMTPLSWSVLRLILQEWEFIPGRATVGNIGGRPYLNISVFATVFKAIKKGRDDLLEAFESTLYMRLPEGMEIPLIPLSRRVLLATLFNALRIQRKQKKAIKDIPACLDTNPAWFAWMRQQIERVDTKEVLLSLWHEEIRPHVTQAVWGILGSATSAADYALRLRRDLSVLVGPDDADKLISNLSGGQGQLESLGPLLGIFKVARGDMERQEYLRRYGHRGPHEFELSVPRPAEDPDWLDRQVAQFTESGIDVEALLDKRRHDFGAAWGRFEARYPRRAGGVRRRIDEMSHRARRREQARSEYVRDRWLMRLFALRAGELTGLSNDIFFLTFDELVKALSDDMTAAKFIAARKQTYERYKALPAYPSAIRGRFDPFQWAADPERRSDFFDAHFPLAGPAMQDEASGVIHGAPGAAGRIEAVVRRLDDPVDGKRLQQGEVLVTMQTDIAWTVLFPRAAAVVTDVGAPLSHAAIVARELGIPAVVGCGDATMRLKTGDRVRVDGGRGIVEILGERGSESG